jgi:hypothetical protein
MFAFASYAGKTPEGEAAISNNADVTEANSDSSQPAQLV